MISRGEISLVSGAFGVSMKIVKLSFFWISARACRESVRFSDLDGFLTAAQS